MSESQSLADQAVDAIAAVRAMCDGVSNDHPERHTIRSLKEVACNIISESLRQARNLAYIAEQLSKDIRKLEATQAQDTPKESK